MQKFRDVLLQMEQLDKSLSVLQITSFTVDGAKKVKKFREDMKFLGVLVSYSLNICEREVLSRLQQVSNSDPNHPVDGRPSQDV